MSEYLCHICHSANLQNIEGVQKDFKPVSSDIRNVDGVIELAVCRDCGVLQKIVNKQWQKDVTKLYDDYKINHQGYGSEPYIFNSIYGSGPRAEILLKFLQSELGIQKKGNMLDVGCANGNILRGFNKIFPEWDLYGMENSEKWRDVILSIPGVKDFFSDRKLIGHKKYDLIVISHVLEHIPEPVTFLRELLSSLTPEGKILIAVPNIRQNPIDLFVFDHCTHFDDETLAEIFKRAQTAIEDLRIDVLNKEIVAIISNNKTSNSLPAKGKYKSNLLDVCRLYFRLAGAICKMASDLQRESNSFGIMGTSTAAVWLTGELDNKVDFYVDEDPSRIGGEVFGKPIYSLNDVPQDGTVFIPLAKTVAEKIINRAPPGIHFEYLDWNETSSVEQLADFAA